MKNAQIPLCFLVILVLFFMQAAPAPAADLSTWHLRNMSLTSAASGNGIYVAVGKYGFMMRSLDGNTWTAVSSGVEDELGGVSYGNGVFVAVGGNTVLVSSDGLNWDEYTPPAGFYCYSIAFGNGSFVALDNNPNSVFTSSDGIAWTEVALPSTTTLSDIIYGLGQFVVVGYSGTVITSPNALTWTPRTSNTTQTLWQVAYRNTPPNVFVAVGASGTVITSPNGVTWTVQASGITQTLMTVGYGNSLFVTSGSNSSSDAGHIWTSPNGITWTEQTSPAYEWFRDVLYAGGNYFLIGGKIITSANGTDWGIVHGATGWDIWGVAYGNGVYAAGTLTGDIIISSDGIRWTQPIYPDVTTIVDMAYCPTNQRFVGGISDGSLIYSDDNGATWDPHPTFVPVVGLNGLYYVHDRFIGACGSGRLILSTNGTTWDHYSTTSLAGLQGAAYGNNTFVVVGDGGTVFTSQDDAATWQVQAAGTGENLKSVAYGNSTFVAAGGINGHVITSPNGIDWTLHDGILPIQTCYSIVFYDDVFLAIGSSGSIYSSSDGTAWSSVGVPDASTFFCGTADGPGVTVVGLNGAIIQLEPPTSTISAGGGGGGGCFISTVVR